MKKRILSLILAVVMIVGCMPSAYAAEQGSTAGTAATGGDPLSLGNGGSSALQGGSFSPELSGENQESKPDHGLSKFESSVLRPFSESEAATHYASDDTVTFIVVAEQKPLLETYSVSEIAAQTDAVQRHEKRQSAALDAVKANVEAAFGDEESFEMGFTYTIATTGFSVTTAYGNREKIAAMPGVKRVYVAPTFSLPEDGMDMEYSPYTNNASTMIGADVLNQSGYTGKGSRIAVLDTGLRLSHPNFAALPESALEDPMTRESVDEVWDELNAGKMTSKLNVSYQNSKVPFAFNYVSGDFDVSNAYAGSDHGTHAAGIAAANKIDSSTVVGVAPDAQLVIMQVFQKGGGAGWDTIMAALEDCVRLDVDSVNLSLGAAAGFTDPADDLMAVMELFQNSSIQVVIAVGNDTNNAYNNNWGNNMSLLENPDTGLAGTPSTYSAALSVASVDNDGFEQLYITVNGQEFGYQDTAATTATSFLANFRDQELQYVVVPGIGEDADYAELDVTGKVALVSRGSNSFPEKQEAAQAHGAIACIVANNALGIINMQINDGGENIPCISISKAAGDYLRAQATDGAGTLKVCNADVKLFKIDRTVSSFSSWGVTPDLKLKPEIAGVGGSIYSSVDPDISGSNYAYMSGTSMATPQISGAMAVLIQYLEANYPSITGAEQRRLAANLLMSTADPLMVSEDLEYSPRAQGAGLANLVSATSSAAYLSNPAASEGRPKVEFGDDPAKRGVYSFSFTITNMAGSARSYEISSSVLTESIYADKFIAGAPYGLEGKVTVEGGNVVTVPAKGTVTVQAKLQLSEADKQYLKRFPNGIYVEGYVYATPVADGEGTQPVRLSMPMVGFYGDWSDADVFDSKDTNAYSLYPSVVFTQKSQLGTNPYFRTGKSGDRYNAFSYANPLAEIDFGMLRNAKSMNITVTDKASGDVYFELTGNYLPKSYYNANYGQIIPFYVLADEEEVWDGTDKDGKQLPDGTQVTYRFEACLDDGDDVVDDVWFFDVTLDNVMPELTNAGDLQSALRFDDETGRAYLRLDILENQYVAAVLFESPSGAIMGKYEVDNTPGQPYSGEFDITGFGSEFSVIVADYACNETRINAYLNLGDHTNDNPSAAGLDANRLYGCETYDGAQVEAGWFSAAKADFSDARNETFDSANRYYSAEYVNGYLVAQNANTGNLELVTPSGTYWKTRTLVTQNGKVGDSGFWVLYDMALDYSGKRADTLDPYGDAYGKDTLFAVGWQYAGDQDNDGHDDGHNALFRIYMSKWNNEMSVTEIGPITGTNAAAEILTLGITTEGEMYGIDTNGCLYGLELSTDDYGQVSGAAATYIGTTDFVNEQNYSGVNVIQSMGYDHNTGTMYWYAHSQTANGAVYVHTNITYRVNLQTAQCTAVGSYGPGGQTCLFVPNDPESDLFILDVDPTGFNVDPYRMTMVEGQTKPMKISWRPWNAKPGAITWRSSDETIATVDQNGFVTAQKAGTVTIQATGLIWDPWHWDETTSTTVPSWVETTQTAEVEIVSAEDAIYSFIAMDYANADNGFSWVTYADKTPGQVTQLSKPTVTYTDPTKGETVTVNALWQGGAYYNGYVYTVMAQTRADDSGFGGATVLYRSKVTKGATPAETVIGEPEEVGFTMGIEAGNIGFDYNTGRMYAVDLSNGGLAILDLDTGALDPLGVFSGDIGGPAIATAMCVTADGTIVIADMASTLYSVDPETLNTTRLGSVSADSWYYAAMTYDYNTGNIYWNPCMAAGLSPLYLVRLEANEWDPSRIEANIVDLGDVSSVSGVEQTAMFTIPEQEPETHHIPVESIEITNGDAATGLIGGTLQLNVITEPARPTVQAKTWTSSDPSVVTVDRFGNLSLVGIGTATVTVSTTNKDEALHGGPFTDSIQVTVLEAAGEMQAFLDYDLGGTAYYDYWISMNDYDLRHATAGKGMISVYSLRSGAYYDGYYYAYNDKGQFMRIHAEDPSDYKILGTVNLDLSYDQVTAMALDYTTGTMYGLTLRSNYDESTSQSVRRPGSLVTIDLNTGAVTPVAELDFDRPVFALACDKDGVLYAAGSTDVYAKSISLYRVDKQTGALRDFATVEGAGAYTGSNYYGDLQYNPQLTYDFGTNRLYLNASVDQQSYSKGYGMYMVQLGGEAPVVTSLGNISLYTRVGSTPKNGDVFLGLLALIPEADEIPTGKVNGILLNKTACRVDVGGTAQLNATVRPSNAANPALTWVSADPSIATVDAAGVITGVSVGATTVTVTSVESGVSVECRVEVVDCSGPQSNAYTVSAQKDALICFNPALPAQTAVTIASFSGGTTICGLAYAPDCLYYVLESNFTFYLYRYDLITRQSTSLGMLEAWAGIDDIAYDAQNNMLYAVGGFYLFQYSIDKLHADGLNSYSNYMMDSDYCALSGVTVVDGAVYTIGTGLYSSEAKLIRYSDKYLGDRTVLVDGFDVNIVAGATEMDYDASTDLFYLTDAGNNIFSMDLDGNVSYVDLLGNGIDLNGLAIDSTLSYTVIYTDGVEEETVFPDQRFNVSAGTQTPAFVGAPTRVGYTFAGWEPEIAETVNAHATYRATWTPNSYTVTLDARGGEVDPQTVSVTYNAPVGELPVPTRAGYTFLGWYNVDGEQVAADTVYTLTEDSMLAAKWAAATYTVTLDPDGGEVDPQTLSVTYNDPIGALPVPVKPGYTFTGWVDATGNSVTAETVYTAADDSVLTATWSANTYTVTLNAGEGASVDPQTIVATFGSPIGALPVPVKPGYTFTGWVDADGNPVTAETVYTVADDSVLTASWSANTYTVTLSAGEGASVDPQTIAATFGSPIGALPVPVKPGYTFTGWVDATGNSVTTETVYTAATDSVLTATWSAGTYTVTLNAGEGASVDPQTIAATFGSPIGALPVPVKPGYTFTGWVDATGNSVTAETVYTAATDSVLTATWSAGTYTVTLNANGGTVDPASMTVTYGAAIGELPVPTRDGFKFSGWKDAQGNLVDASTVYTMTEDSELTASWTEQIPGSVNTGDRFPIVAVVVLLVLAVAAIVVLTILAKKSAPRSKKRRGNKEK